MNVRLKLSDEHCPLGGLWKLKLQVGLCPGQVGHYLGKAGHCLLCGLWKDDFSQNPPLFPKLDS
jgi:hypothetical protein